MTRLPHSAASALSLLLGAGLASPLPAQPQAPAAERIAEQLSEPLVFQGLGPHTRKVTTTNPKAQTYFNQGLNWMYSFNHDEAIRSFEHAAKLDPACAMAWWGIAICNGPHINAPVMEERQCSAAWEALQKAKANLKNATPVEKALITALEARYVDPASPPGGKLPLSMDERRPLDQAYADAMAKVYAAHKDDADVATMYAEALMDLRPWDLYEVGTHAPRPETGPAVAALEHALKLNPNHPGANHYYIHAIEGSSTPEKADEVADRLRTLVPASGHMVHMPSHIDARVGRWALAAEQNRKAIEVDRRYRELSPTHGIYHLYMAHDDHFLAYTCMMLGRREEAVRAAGEMVRKIPADFMVAAAPFVDAYTPIQTEVLVRFAMWDEVLAFPEPPEHLPITRALWRQARATAFNAKGMRSEALEEHAAFRKAKAAVPKDAMMAQNPAHTVLELADLLLSGELKYFAGSLDAAVADLNKAAEIEDSLRYIEPPDWVQPVRHTLGAILLDAGRAKDAEAVYRTDLQRNPNNGWALFGLAQSLKAQGKDSKDAEQRYKKAWEHADTPLHASCLCLPEKK
jgi:tetratricopeptide (TPR) repeat protein